MTHTPMAPHKDIVITTLVSIGKHPLSGRTRRADEDARAVELMLRFAPRVARAVHVGEAHHQANLSALREYLGMGIGAIDVLAVNKDSDVSEPLCHYWSAGTENDSTPPDIILTGVRSEEGESSGLLPYLLARRLNMPLVANVCAITKVDKAAGYAQLMQSLPRGQRRNIQVSLPFIGTVSAAAPPPRQVSFGKGKRGTIKVVTGLDASLDSAFIHWHKSPAQPRAKRLKVVKAKSATQRFKAATARQQGGAGTKIYEPEKAAQAILALLRDEKVL